MFLVWRSLFLSESKGHAGLAGIQTGQ